MLEKPEDVKTTFHYGITKPCNIDGGIHDHKRFYYNRICFELLFFVHEDQEQIIFLLVETFTYLSVAESFKKKIRESCNSSCLGKDWCSHDRSKCQKNWMYHAIHFLCKSHTEDKLHSTNLELLVRAEKAFKQSNTFEV